MSGPEPAAKQPASWQLRLLETVWEGVISAKSQWNPEKSCYDLARDYVRGGRAVDESIQSLVDWQAAKAGAGGFVLGLPGLVLSAVSIPADLTMTTYIQLRMVAVIALLRGWDVQMPALKTVAFLSLLGSDATGFMQKLGLDPRAATPLLLFSNMPGQILHKINGAIASKLMVSAGKTSVIGMVKFVPVVGGLVNGGLDGFATRAIGRQANILFRAAPTSTASDAGPVSLPATDGRPPPPQA